jgi:heat shock protein HslJ
MEHEMRNVVLLLLVVFVFALSACGSPLQSLSGEYKLVSYGDPSNLTLAAPDVDTSIVFDPDGKIGGSVGCNSFGGDYKIAKGKLEFGPIMSTLMACEEPRMTQESSVFAVLNGTVDFKLDGSVLTITSADGTMQIVLEKK